MVDQTVVREDEIYAEGEVGQDLSPTIQQDRHEHDSGNSESRGSESRDSEGGYVESLAAYMHNVAQKPLLTAAEERNLARRVQSGCPRAKDKLIEHNMRLVIHNAKRFRELGLDFEELVQEGMFGLIRAVEKFDPEMGYKFSTYATWWIRQKAGRAIMEKGRSVRLPVHYQEQLRKLSQAENKLALELGREPSTEELAEALEVSADKVSELRYRRRPIGSLDAPVTGSEQASGEDKDSARLVSFIRDGEQDEEPEEHVRHTERRERLWQCLASLPERERYVLGRRYGLMGEDACTLEELARELGNTREVVRQAQKRAEKRLKTALGALEAA